MQTERLQLGLTDVEVEYAVRTLKREPNELEWAIIDAEWSEHCSYKSSKSALKMLPTAGPHVLVGPGYDAGIIDVGDGYLLSLHIESHNHPSAVDPYGGAATGIGGVIRDILSAGTRPIALIDVLRFGPPDTSVHSRWLFGNVVRGISDYGNCVGIPTVAGDIEFDPCFERNCLVDVGCVGLGRKEDLIFSESKMPGDLVLLVGGSTGRDGIQGATFASKNLERDADSKRSAVQVPDPFMKKLLVDSILEAVEAKLVRAMKDLGGGGLSTGLTEIAEKGGTGIDVELERVNVREPDMTPTEVMTSESQERMVLIIPPENLKRVAGVFGKYDVPCSVIGTVTSDGLLVVRKAGKVVARLPAAFVAKAQLLPRTSTKPSFVHPTEGASHPKDVTAALLSLLSSPGIASRSWVYEQYDNEVGARTVVKPGQGDAAVLKLPNGRFLAVKADGNSKVSFIDPYLGAAGCVAEACRNVVAVGAEPVAMVDHLQHGDPSDPEAYWCFEETVRGVADYCREVGVPVVGGKVSFYNEDASTKRAIKPTPVALVVGLVQDAARIRGMRFNEDGDELILAGETRAELGGSEYYERILNHTGGTPPAVNPSLDAALYKAIMRLTERGMLSAVHDCGKGGLAVALSEMAIASRRGVEIDLERTPARSMDTPSLLFSESNGRFLLASRPEESREVAKGLAMAGVPSSTLGVARGKRLVMKRGAKSVIDLSLAEIDRPWRTCLQGFMEGPG